jgi:hypothetical protein
MPTAARWRLPASETVTIGLPFCVFKGLTGLVAVRSESPAVSVVGYALIALGTLDALINTINLIALVTAHRSVTGACTIDIVTRRLGTAKHADLGLALDVFLSFGLVAIVIGGGLLVRVPVDARRAWNIAVVLNVLGAGVGRLVSALRTERAA